MYFLKHRTNQQQRRGNEMNKEDLMKLAVVAGVTVKEFQIVSSHNSVLRVDHCCGSIWRPHEDLAQAFEVLEGWRSLDDLSHYMVSSPRLQSCIKCYDLDLYCYDSDGFIYTVKGQHEYLPEAICQAVLKAQGEG